MPPLTNWACDACGDAIDDPRRGLVAWRDDEEGRAIVFMIVHKNIDGRSCDPGSEAGYRSSLDIAEFLGDVGQARLLAMLSVGRLLEGNVPGVADLDAYVDLFRRVQTPWYEEARGHWDDEATTYWLDDANEVYPYTPDVLEKIATGKLGS